MRFTTHSSSFATTLAAMCLLAGCLERAEDPLDRTEPIRTSEAVASITQADCVAGGATAADNTLANQLRPQMNGHRLGGAINGYNVSCARAIIDTTRGRPLASRAAVIAVTAAITESTLHNYTQAVDHDSLGLFQQRPSAGWGTPAQVTNPIYATNAFLNAMLRLFPGNGWMTGDIGAICQRVQVSAFPDAYSVEAHDAQLLVNALWAGTGTAPGGAQRVFSGGNGILYGIRPNGDLMWYRHLDPNGGTVSWAHNQGVKVGNGWNDFKTVFSGGDGVIYGVRPNGDLMWYRHLDPNGGTVSWAFNQGVKVGEGWSDFLAIFSGGNGVIYGVRPNGELQWYRHLDPTGGYPSWMHDYGLKVGDGWNGFTTIIAAGNGVIYGVRPNGDLQWYRHLDPMGGSVSWAFNQGVKIGDGWNGLTTIISGGNGVIYGIRPNADLQWYRHLDPTGGYPSWMHDFGVKIGDGWTGF